MKQAVLCNTKKRICVIAAAVICAIVAALFLFACDATSGKVESYTVTYIASDGGEIIGDDIQKINYNESGYEVTAVADNGYSFVGWSDGNISPTRKEIWVFEDVELVALFKKKTYRVIFDIIDGEHISIDDKLEQYVEHGESVRLSNIHVDMGFRVVFATGIYDELKKEFTEMNITEDLKIKVLVYPKPIRLTVAINDDNMGWVEKNDLSITDWILRAVPKDGYVFVEWSDGEKSAERHISIDSDYQVTANFGYSAEYRIYENTGGRIIGDIYQVTLPHGNFSSVRAEPDDGYVFLGWSDDNDSLERADTNASECLNVYAVFGKIRRTFLYDYGVADGSPYVNNVTINRNDLSDTMFILPTYNGYEFCGWYADSDYKTKVVNSNGIYMIGNYGFEIDSDTLYARWKKDEVSDEIVYKILLVFVEKIDAMMYSGKTEKYLDVNYLMTWTERSVCYESWRRVSETLNEWFDGSVSFEIDAYFTRENINEQAIFADSGSNFVSGIFLTEINPLRKLYHNIIVGFSFGDKENYMNIQSRLTSKYNSYTINMNAYYRDKSYMSNTLISLRNEKEEYGFNGLIYWIIVKLAECADVSYPYTYPLTAILLENKGISLRDLYRDYFLCKIKMKEQFIGIPPQYWENEIVMDY